MKIYSRIFYERRRKFYCIWHVDWQSKFCCWKSKKYYFPKPIAIIIGKNTSSSGEISAAIFYGKPNIKFFGEPTGGALSINEGHKINDNLELIITTAFYQTTDKKIHYDEKLYPDYQTNNPIKDAIKWINNFKKVW